MISNRSILLLGATYQDRFAYTRDGFYEYLFTHNYEPKFCQVASDAFHQMGMKNVMIAIANGNVIKSADETLQRNAIQKVIFNLAQDILVDRAPARENARAVEASMAHANALQTGSVTSTFGGGGNGGYAPELQTLDELQNSLELDGYKFDGKRLLQYEVDVINTVEEAGILHRLYRQAGLNEAETAFHFLSLSNEHFVAKRWGDAIHQARNFLEFTMARSAQKWAAYSGIVIPDVDSPAGVRTYLNNNDVLSFREQQMLDVLYGLLSNTGSHPYIAAADQARLCLNMVLTYTQFILIRLEGKLNERRSPSTATL